MAEKSILVFTQKVHREDPVLGFFHEWILKMSPFFKKITVVCLEKGMYKLPENVSVLSLGKEKGLRKSAYIKNFYKIIWNERKNYDLVFVHMNPEYVVLGFCFWFILRKKVYLWYNHSAGGLKIWTSQFLTKKVFHTSDFAYTAKFKNAVKMPVGIPMDIFKQMGVERKPQSILSLGRIARIKKIENFVEAGKILNERKIDFKIDIYGNAQEKDRGYFNSIRKNGASLMGEKKLEFFNGIPNYKTPEVFSAHDFFINLSPAGLFDKTVFEACACETVPIVSSKAFVGFLPKECILENDSPETLSERIRYFFSISNGARVELGKNLRMMVEKEHSLEVLLKRLTIEINQ